MIPPENAWLRRSNDDIIIGCYSSQQTWQLKCDGHEWKGLVGTCPELCKTISAKCVLSRQWKLFWFFMIILTLFFAHLIMVVLAVFTKVYNLSAAAMHCRLY